MKLNISLPDQIAKEIKRLEQKALERLKSLQGSLKNNFAKNISSVELGHQAFLKK